MTVLTDDELAQVLRNRFTTECDARAIERAMVAKLHAQGIDTSPERVEETAKRVHDDVELPRMPPPLTEFAYFGGTVQDLFGRPEMQAYARAAVLADREKQAKSVAALLDALKFYADQDHFIIADDDAWDTVSGEPKNFFCDEAGTATVEDGSIARAALSAQEGK